MNGARAATYEFLATFALLGLGVVPVPAVQKAIASLKNPGLNLADTEQTERGYYEAILDAGRRIDGAAPSFSNDRTPSEAAADAPMPFESDPRVIRVDDLRLYALKARYHDTKRGVNWTTNSWGLRDREYNRAKPSNTFRIAFLGDSIGAGWGVDDGRSFEALLETRLGERSHAAGGPAIEILNFSVPGHAPGQRWENFERLGGWSLGIDMVIYEATPAEPAWDERRLRITLPRGLGWDAPQYARVLSKLESGRARDTAALKKFLHVNRFNILECVYNNVVAECRGRNVPCAWVLVPRVGRATDMNERRRLIELARRAGFSPIVDLSDAFDGVDASKLAVAPDDYHPNAVGHALLFERLQRALTAPTGDFARGRNE